MKTNSYLNLYFAPDYLNYTSKKLFLHNLNSNESRKASEILMENTGLVFHLLLSDLSKLTKQLKVMI